MRGRANVAVGMDTVSDPAYAVKLMDDIQEVSVTREHMDDIQGSANVASPCGCVVASDRAKRLDESSAVPDIAWEKVAIRTRHDASSLKPSFHP